MKHLVFTLAAIALAGIAFAQTTSSTITGPATIPAGEAGTYEENRATTTNYAWTVNPDGPMTQNGASAIFKPATPGDYVLTCNGTDTQRVGWFGRRRRQVAWADQVTVKVTDPRPLGKWQVAYGGNTQMVKAVTADDAIQASVPPAPDVKAVDVKPHPFSARGPPPKRMRGFTPTPKGKLQAAIKAGEPLMAKLRALPQPPDNYDGSGGFRQFTMYGNDVYGDCVTAEEAAAKAVISAKTGAAPVVIPDASVIAYCQQYGGLNGANLDEVLQRMTQHGLIDGAGKEHKDDSNYVAIDGTKELICKLAIYYTGQIKVGVAAGQIQNADTGDYGWTLLNAQPDNNTDHCVGYNIYGSLKFCCDTLGVPVPTGADPNRFCLGMYTWSKIGILSWESGQNVTTEWWMRGTDPDRLDATAWNVTYQKVMADLVGGNVTPPDAAVWTVTYSAQAAVVVDARDAADAISRVPYTGKATAIKADGKKW